MADVVQQAHDMRIKFLAESHYGKLPVVFNTEKFGNFVARETKCSIESVTVPDMGELRGMILRRSEKDALVLISDKNNECWKRFTYIKEISHIFIDQSAETFNSNSYEQARSLVERHQATVELTKEQEQFFNSELSGILAAIEIMLPDSIMDYVEHLSRVDKMLPYSIAFRLKIPQTYLEYKMAQRKIPINASP